MSLLQNPNKNQAIILLVVGLFSIVMATFLSHFTDYNFLMGSIYGFGFSFELISLIALARLKSKKINNHKS
ncbi:hypothetical protein [Zunongwangia sp.]|uniref:hypothetical protein n=1 Tax=Zunongwangia sp. TaxID=1965325 RepID=UPI003AA99D06